MNPGGGRLDFVTIVYGPELLLLRLQARSFTRFANADSVGEIIVVVNEKEPAATVRAVEGLRDQYGPHAERVRVVPSTDVWTVPATASGWRTQQSLKLLLSRQTVNPRYVALDAKNHFLRPFDHDTFVDPEGLVRTRRQRPRNNRLAYFENALNYFSVDPAAFVEQAMPTTTPFVLYRDDVRAMLDEVERREGVAFDVFFSRRRDITEFFLYTGFLLARYGDLSQHYRMGSRLAHIIWGGAPANDDDAVALLEKMVDSEAVALAVHSKRVKVMGPVLADGLARFWVAIGLLDSEAEGRDLIAEQQAAIAEREKAPS